MPKAIQGGRAWTSGPREPLDRYRHLVGVEAYRGALQELSALSRSEGFALLLFTTYEVREILPMLEIARQVGVPTLSMMVELEAWFEEQLDRPFDEKAYRHSPLVVSPQNEHPSALQHRMAAARLLFELEQRGILGTLLRRRGLDPAPRGQDG